MYFDNDESLENNVPFFLIFDVETTGLPKRNYGEMPYYKYLDRYNESRVVQLSFSTYTEDGTLLKEYDYIINCNSGDKLLRFTIPESSTEIHGITEDISIKKGITMEHALYNFINEVIDVKVLVAHNLNFDINILMSEIWRLQIAYRKKEHEKYKFINMINELLKTEIYCTMLSTIDLCKIPFKNSYSNKKDNWKFPKLEELYEKLFHVKPTNCHNALYDIRYTAKCFFKLKEMWFMENNNIWIRHRKIQKDK